MKGIVYVEEIFHFPLTATARIKGKKGQSEEGEMLYATKGEIEKNQGNGEREKTKGNDVEPLTEVGDLEPTRYAEERGEEGKKTTVKAVIWLKIIIDIIKCDDRKQRWQRG